jgi:hypothetical protein
LVDFIQIPGLWTPSIIAHQRLAQLRVVSSNTAIFRTNFQPEFVAEFPSIFIILLLPFPPVENHGHQSFLCPTRNSSFHVDQIHLLSTTTSAL